MENKEYIILILALGLWPALVFGYDNQTIHPMLTKAAIGSYESYGGQKLSQTDKQTIVSGSIEEDDSPRWLEHFYDPINNVGLNKGQFATSKRWSHNQASVTNNYSWENAIYEYVYGDKNKALNDLGHIIHLIQDKTVPEHTRDDAHPLASTYESYTKNLTSVPSALPIYLGSIDDYFDQTAKFTNTNFFSDDTILSNYVNPNIKNEFKEAGDDGKIRIYGYGDLRKKIVLVNNDIDSNGSIVKSYSIYDKNDNQVISDYWSTLAPRAVGYSAGVIKLFFDEVAKEQTTGVLKKAREPWWQKLADLAKVKIDQALAMVNLSKKNPLVLPTTKADQLVSGPSVGVGDGLTPEQIRLERLAVLENRLRSLQAELQLLTNPDQNQVLMVIRSVNSTLSSAGITPVVETALTDTSATTNDLATTTATTTEEKLDDGPITATLSVKNCRFSLTANPCLLKATTSLSLLWQVNKLGDYKYDLIKTYLDDNYEWAEGKVLESSSTDHLIVDSKLPSGEYFTTFYWQVVVHDASTSQIVATSSKIETNLHVSPLMINEIGWAGTTASEKDQWLELFNPSQESIVLNNFYLTFGANNTKIDLAGNIGANSYYLIERDSDEVISNRPANLIQNFGGQSDGSAFDVSNLSFKLWQKIAEIEVLIEETPVWNKSNQASSSLERVGFYGASNENTNWLDNLGCNLTDGPCALDRNATTTFGTPKVKNWASIPRLI